jgi:divalent metal cation (Fe/Co/Zn/Cd) transporter
MTATTVSDRIHSRSALIGAAVGTTVLAAKYLAFQLTGSVAVYAAALETLAAVIAAVLTLGGAGRLEAEGGSRRDPATGLLRAGMLVFAAAMILNEAGEALVFGHQVRNVQIGVVIVAGSALVDAILGWLLVRMGTRHRIAALGDDGAQHLAAFWTSAAAVVALVSVLGARIPQLDTAVAVAIGLHLVWIGLRQARRAAHDWHGEPDAAALDGVLHAINANLLPGVIRVRGLRAVRTDDATHVFAQLIVPEFWTVEEAHDFRTAFERRLLRNLGTDDDVTCSIEPCRRQFCASCEVEPCPLRVQPFVERQWIRRDDAVRTDLAGQ